ncbi:uncharacterized protein ASPGLDRAFT_23213 [Aspergillus glaucus CBS 516.65]|uniref:C2H2-type domain-containing protein n=1 Tax=Aspergillus glaucus CBS 516.65 TaxID=1160497 RepID=A0A1L9VTE8_ASPGL|nr:hypothetical protein ASPGLDRAFT_23213 [Aspergillus glaucus CBS 516.65]OJJ87175.1 hypothetical protein ASPGLDRAFT_23213 [Aspergillus glaucus CBS 516.65]
MSKRSRGLSTSPPTDPSPLETRAKSSSPALSTPQGRSKQLHLQDTTNSAVEVMRCSLPPHMEALSFASYVDYEVHYRQTHVNRCVECGKNFPTDLFLNLHIEENHDSLMVARRERGEKTYGCFIEGCERKCSTPQKRRMHLIDKHMFPKTYNFYIVNDGIDKQTSLLRPMNSSNRRRLSNAPTSPKEGRLRNRQTSISQQGSQPLPISSTGGASQTQTKKNPDDMDIADLEKSMSALRFVPTSVTRNRGKPGSRA